MWAWPLGRGRGPVGGARRGGALPPAISGPGPNRPRHAARPRRLPGALVGGLAARAAPPRLAPAARASRFPPAGPRLPAGTDPALRAPPSLGSGPPSPRAPDAHSAVGFWGVHSALGGSRTDTKKHPLLAVTAFTPPAAGTKRSSFRGGHVWAPP